MDSQKSVLNRPEDMWIHMMLCWMFNVYLSIDLETAEEFVPPTNLPMVRVSNIWRQVDTYHCGTHITQ
eukprot:5760002-Ditylum_brightwellii.AAC.1